MIVVVYGHCLLDHDNREASSFFVFTYPFNVVLFFAISGYLFNPRKGNQKEFFKYLFFRLIIPWLVLGLFPYYNLAQRLPLLLSGKVLWFMPAFIYAEIIWFYIHKYSKSRNMIFLFGILSTIVGMVMYDYGWLNYGMINRAFTLQYLFILGYLIKFYEGQVKVSLKQIVPMVILYILGVVVFQKYYPYEFYDAHYNRYYFVPLTIGLIILGIFIAFSIFENLSKIPRWLVIIGQNTLFIYIFSGLFQTLFMKYFMDYFTFTFIPFPVIAVFQAIFTVVICSILSEMANIYAPWIVGRKK